MSVGRSYLAFSSRSPKALWNTRSCISSTMQLPVRRKGYNPENSWSRNYHETNRVQGIRSGEHRAFIALGSNVGDRIGMIESACSDMTRRGITVRRTSSLYETQAMYKVDQDPFINGACEIATRFSPFELLDQLKDIETTLGRQKTVENGPRNIDLDILLYGDDVVQDERLQIPHPRISEREFVLRPLCDLIPHSSFPHPNDLPSFSSQLSILPPPTFPLSPLTPLSPAIPPLASTLPSRRTHIMAILNLTPDSFSADGLHTPTFNPSSLLPTLQSLLTSDVSILDIGGQSTRPHATPLSALEELSRVLPTIQFIRSNPEFNNLALSIDTYHSSVARACVKAGANIVNDVSAGTLDPNMLSTVADLGCTVIFMHMRGNPETMTSLTSYPFGIIPDMASELQSRVQAAEEAGIRRWRIILDPGIGFAKTGEQNLELLRRFGELRSAEGLKGLPWCVGVSRKGFIGKVTGVKEAAERIWGTAGAVSACVAGGADIVRVHDWREMEKTVRMTDAIWRV